MYCTIMYLQFSHKNQLTIIVMGKNQLTIIVMGNIAIIDIAINEIKKMTIYFKYN